MALAVKPTLARIQSFHASIHFRQYVRSIRTVFENAHEREHEGNAECQCSQISFSSYAPAALSLASSLVAAADNCVDRLRFSEHRFVALNLFVVAIIIRARCVHPCMRII